MSVLVTVSFFAGVAIILATLGVSFLIDRKVVSVETTLRASHKLELSQAEDRVALATRKAVELECSLKYAEHLTRFVELLKLMTVEYYSVNEMEMPIGVSLQEIHCEVVQGGAVFKSTCCDVEVLYMTLTDLVIVGWERGYFTDQVMFLLDHDIQPDLTEALTKFFQGRKSAQQA